MIAGEGVLNFLTFHRGQDSLHHDLDGSPSVNEQGGGGVLSANVIRNEVNDLDGRAAVRSLTPVIRSRER